MSATTFCNFASSDNRTLHGAAPHRENAEQGNNDSDGQCLDRNSLKDDGTQVIIRQAVDHLIGQLEAGHSDMLAAYLRTIARFHNYSFGNILQIARQRPTATRVAGFGKWKELGRFVKRGEKGIQILAPVTVYRRRKAELEEETDSNRQQVLIGFRPVYVFDYAQTEGADLPELNHTISGDVDGVEDRLIEFLAQQNISLEFDQSIQPSLGVSYGGRIAILPGQSKAGEFTTLVHETAHELLHRTDRRTFTTKVIRETEAEAVAFIVGQAVGLEMGTASSDYIQLYHGNAALLAESLEIIQHTASTILRALHAEEAKQSAATGSSS